MGIGRESTTGLQFATEILQFLPWNAAFEIGTAINAGGRVPLEVDDIAVARLGPRLKEMVEGDFVKSGGRSKCGNVTANALLDFVRANHHGEGIPAHQALNATLHLLTAGKRRLLPRRNGVLIGSSCGKRQVYTGRAPRMQGKLLQ